jgi:hypothetical protein
LDPGLTYLLILLFFYFWGVGATILGFGMPLFLKSSFNSLGLNYFGL